MLLEDCKEIIQEIEESLSVLIEKNVEVYGDIETSVPIFLDNFDEIKHLKELYFKNYFVCDFLKQAYNVKEDLIKKSFQTKLLLDSLLTSHKDFSTKKFWKEFEDKKSEYEGVKRIRFKEKFDLKKHIIVKEIIKFLVSKDRIENNSTNRIGIASMFFPINNRGRIEWKNYLYDLRLFFDILKKENLIVYPEYYKEFISDRFRTLNNGKFQDVDIKSYKSAKVNTGYEKNYPVWENEITNLFKKLTLPKNDNFR